MAAEALARNTEVQLPRVQKEYSGRYKQAVASLGLQSLDEPWEDNDVNLLSS